MLSRVNSVANIGLTSVLVEVEVDVATQGFPATCSFNFLLKAPATVCVQYCPMTPNLINRMQSTHLCS